MMDFSKMWQMEIVQPVMQIAKLAQIQLLDVTVVLAGNYYSIILV
jgi:hypothetical protein